MKKYLGHLLLTLLSCVSFVLIYYTASRGILPFDDSLSLNLSLRLQTSLKSVNDQAKEVLLRLEALAGDDVIIHSLVQFELGESLEKGALAVRRLANSIADCEALRLVGIDDIIVLDSANDALEGKPLRNDEKQRMRLLLQKPGSFEFLPDGRAEVAVRCLSRAGNDVGVLRALFAPAFLARHIYSGATKALTINGVVFLTPESLQLKQETLAAMAVELRKSMQVVHAADAVLVPVRGLFSSQIFVGIAPRKGELPGIAGQILVLNGLLIAALLLLLVLRVLNHCEHGRLETVKAQIDSHDKTMQELQASAEEIIKATDTLYFSEQVEHQPTLELPQPAEGEMPTLAGILSKKHTEPAAGLLSETKEHDLELQSAIDQVAFGQKDALDREADPEVHEKVVPPEQTTEASGIEAWWERMVSLLERSFDIGDVLLLEEDAEGIFRVTRRTGFSEECETACILSSREKLYTLFAARHKVLFIREAALQTANMQRRFPGVSQEAIEQLCYVPVLEQDRVRAILVFGRKSTADTSLDQQALQELQLLSII